MPPAGEHIWQWYMDADDKIGRIVDGVCQRINPTEWVAWAALTGNLVYSWEYDILAAMDRAYCGALNVEIEAGRAMEQSNG